MATRNVKIVAVFSEPVDPASVTASSFEVFSGAGNISKKRCEATFFCLNGSFQIDSNVVSFMPDSFLEYETIYGALVTTAIKDTAGNRLSSDFFWSFTTEDGRWFFSDGKFSITHVAAQDNGIVYAAGIYNGFTLSGAYKPGEAQLFIARFDAEGELEWVVKREFSEWFWGPGGLLIDGSSLYVGYKLDSQSRTEKLTTEGESVWDAPGIERDLVIQNNALYGWSAPYLIKMGLDGATEKKVRFGGYYPGGVAGAIGNIYVSGMVGICRDLFLSRFDKDLNVTGYLAYGANDGKRPCGGYMAVSEPHDVIYLWGHEYDESEIFVIAYNLAANLRWKTTTAEKADKRIAGFSMSESVIGPNGEIYLTQAVCCTESNQLLRLNLDGTIQWRAVFGRKPHHHDPSVALVGNTVFLADGSNELLRFNKETGQRQ